MLHKKSTAAWLEIGGQKHYFRSLWERNYVRWLQFQVEAKLIDSWAYEPHTFWFEGIKRGCVSYKPDFCIRKLDGSEYWIEVKGYYDPKSITKIKRFKKYYPNHQLFLVDSKWFKENSKKLKLLIPDWEGAV